MNTTEQPIELSPLKDIELVITVTDEPVTLPPELQNDIDKHWQGMITERPNLFNGPVYSATSAKLTPNAMVVSMAPTNFAHNVYSEKYDAGKHAYRVFHSAALVVTRDNYIVLGQMGQHTARAGAICCSGGAIDPDDIQGGRVDLTGNTARELSEELGIDVSDPTQVTAFAPVYLKTGGPKQKMTAVYRADLALTAGEFQKQYDSFVAGLTARGETPEFSHLYIVRRTPADIAAFIATHSSTLDEYVAPVLQDISATS